MQHVLLILFRFFLYVRVCVPDRITKQQKHTLCGPNECGSGGVFFFRVPFSVACTSIRMFTFGCLFDAIASEFMLVAK